MAWGTILLIKQVQALLLALNPVFTRIYSGLGEGRRRKPRLVGLSELLQGTACAREKGSQGF